MRSTVKAKVKLKKRQVRRLAGQVAAVRRQLHPWTSRLPPPPTKPSQRQSLLNNQLTTEWIIFRTRRTRRVFFFGTFAKFSFTIMSHTTSVFPAVLLLEDGSVHHGQAFGKKGTA